MINRVHHIAFVVRDLERAIHLYQDVFKLNCFKRFYFEERGAEIALFQIEGLILELICPQEKGHKPYEHLEKYGEGFFHIAYEVDDLELGRKTLEMYGMDVKGLNPSTGVDWQLLWLNSNQTMGTKIQIVEEKLKEEGKK
ncbi:methylmalonyl-CoA/ethylmalonyl-CoA epimerase [Evansella vedderi]|uniref:Methylmalonyl-CoA/ethylmalonyl-CoA epimerase n=1 Tax=Evansella vedderi TaxID=38282 RepID=A0ABT9ZYG6_9BACI|nr:VOC family protein [Evansella vedderi]MDQ0256293.1 methylmalonyl-CoA/ethylmalonyl-CoA epimerase [Evansella vedderi]